MQLQEVGEHYASGGNLDDDPNDQSSKKRQDDETLSQIEELEKKLDEQMSGMYEQNQQFAQDDDEETLSNLGAGNNLSYVNRITTDSIQQNNHGGFQSQNYSSSHDAFQN